jgi:hypothetical protein
MQGPFFRCIAAISLSSLALNELLSLGLFFCQDLIVKSLPPHEKKSTFIVAVSFIVVPLRQS